MSVDVLPSPVQYSMKVCRGGGGQSGQVKKPIVIVKAEGIITSNNLVYWIQYELIAKFKLPTTHCITDYDGLQIYKRWLFY